MEIVESILTENPCYKAGKKIAVKGLMLHSVGCPQPSAQTFVRKWNNAEASRACVHAFIDGGSGKVYQTLPWDHRAWHGGGSSNNTHIGVEMCEPSCIKYTGGASFTCSDREAAMAVVRRTYGTAVELFAFLCGKFGLDPLADGVIVSHKEGHARGIASGHGDPDHLWNGMQCGYTMDGFRRDVSAAMGGAAPAKSAPEAEKARKGQERAQEAVGSGAGAAGTVREGSVVAVAGDAVYYSGKEMPEWVKLDRWIVKSVAGDRVVIDRNVSGSRAICSPVNMKHLRLVTEGGQAARCVQGSQGGENGQAVRCVQGSQGGESGQAVRCGQGSQGGESGQAVRCGQGGMGGEMAISDRGVELIARYEGCRLEAYQCAAGVWTIGYGHTAGVKQGDRLSSQEEAKRILKEDLKKYGGYVNGCVSKGMISFPLNQNQFDALTSFCYNCGNGSLGKLVSGRDAAAVAESMLAYNKGGGKVLEGLVRRRKEERALFLEACV